MLKAVGKLTETISNFSNAAALKLLLVEVALEPAQTHAIPPKTTVAAMRTMVAIVSLTAFLFLLRGLSKKVRSLE